MCPCMPGIVQELGQRKGNKDLSLPPTYLFRVTDA